MHRTEIPQREGKTRLTRVLSPRILALLLVSFCSLSLGSAAIGSEQNKSLPFQAGEQLHYGIRFKWGIIMTKAGSAKYSIVGAKYKGEPTLYSSLSFRTSSFFDKIFKIRDTLYTHSSLSMKPLFHQKFLHEGGTHYTENLVFTYFTRVGSKAVSTRIAQDGTIRFEKELEAPGLAFDMLSVFAFARTINYDNLSLGEVTPLSAFVGKDVVKMEVKYVGQAILDKSEKEKYKSLKFEVDIIDEAFESSKKAMELWVSDDANRIPLKVKAKLKIGSAEADLENYKGLKYPLHSLIVLTPKK